MTLSVKSEAKDLIIGTDGASQAKGKIFRIAHMGFIDTVDLLGTIGGLEEVLTALGYKVQPGAGLKAAQEVLAKEAAV